jgi:RNA-directed DNA polymerase
MEHYYVTGYAPRQHQQTDAFQLTMDECYAAYQGRINIPAQISMPSIVAPSPRFFQTKTRRVDSLNLPAPNILQKMAQAEATLMTYLRGHNDILRDTTQAYEKFYVPKRSGGLREINAPSEELKSIQRNILHFFMHDLGMLPHNAAFAYIAGRGTKECMMVHQQNESQWFLKLDIKDFFPSCTESFVEQALHRLYPIPFIGQDNLKEIISACALNGALPQGAPSSPYLTNLIMIPYDYELTNRLWDCNRTHYAYTRYADDIIISSKYEFDSNQITAIVCDILKDTPFKIKTEKTRYGSRAGRNWNLGLMLNKDNNISLGHKFKQRFRAAVFSFLMDYKNNIQWKASDTHQLIGWYSYFKNIEPDYAFEIISRYESKVGVSWYDAVKWMLN